MTKYSFSKLSTFASCPKKFYYSYVLNLVKAEQHKAFAWGTAFHCGVAGQPDEPSVPYEIGKLAAAWFAANSPYRVTATEVEGEYQLLSGNVLTARVDALTADATVEYKTTSRCTAENYAALSLSFQNRIACKVFGKRFTLLRICKKSLIRQKASESEEQFEARFLAEYQNAPEAFFTEFLVPVDTDIEVEISNIHQGVEIAQITNKYYANSPYGCYGMTACPYLPLCQDFATNRQLYVEKEVRNDPVTEE